MSEPTVFEEASRLERERVPFALCTVADTDRSTPRNGGARMLVRIDGSIVGTIGGGPLEANVIGQAVEALQAGRSMTSLYEAKLQVHPDDDLHMKCGGSVRVLIDAQHPGSRVLVFGAGHVGLKVAGVASLSGWATLLLDDRPDRLALAPGLPTCRFEVDDVAAACAQVKPGDFAVIVTRCHDVDEKVLAALMQTEARYIGLIGSKAKVATIYRNLRAADLPDPSNDPRVYAPIGLALGGKEPGEIAVSVVAELLAVRDGAEAHHRRLPARSVSTGS